MTAREKDMDRLAGALQLHSESRMHYPWLSLFWCCSFCSRFSGPAAVFRVVGKWKMDLSFCKKDMFDYFDI